MYVIVNSRLFLAGAPPPRLLLLGSRVFNIFFDIVPGSFDVFEMLACHIIKYSLVLMVEPVCCALVALELSLTGILCTHVVLHFSIVLAQFLV